ncbi:MAG: hypothetical protein HOO67_01090 [Candidatus Peribacteraceae bacterium]|nr:hypothetical protein [Candidatus Peribacteraceae bacterium]
MSVRLFLRVWLLLGALAAPLRALAADAGGLYLLEPIGGVSAIPTNNNPGLGVFGFYFDLLYPWVVGMAAATAVLMAVIGGIQIIQAGSDQGAVGNGKNRLLLSMAGLLIILASATIMNVFNPTFYR